MNQQMDLLGAWAVAHERELRLSPRGRAVGPRRPQHRARGLWWRRRAVSAVARG